MTVAAYGVDQDAVDAGLLARGFPLNDATRQLARESDWDYIQTLDPRTYVSTVGYADITGLANANLSISERVAQLQSLPINGGIGTVTTTSPTMGISIPPISPGSAPPGGLGGLARQLGQGIINQGVESAADWLKRQLFGGFAEDKPQGSSGGGGQVPRIGQGGVVMGGRGGIDLPMGGEQGAGGVIFVPGKGMVLRRSYGPVTITRDTKVKFDQYGNLVLRPKRMNVLNPHALARAFRRTQGFAHVAKSALQMFGMHVSGTPRLKSKRGKKRFGRR